MMNSNKSKHTPGPWRKEDGHGCTFDVLGANGDWVATVHNGIDADEFNARLIAAAPELLVALELCYEHCRLYHPEVETNNVGEQVRAAIKKARGETK